LSSELFVMEDFPAEVGPEFVEKVRADDAGHVQAAEEAEVSRGADAVGIPI